MRQGLTNTNILKLVDLFLTQDENHIKQSVQNIVDQYYGLDTLVDDDHRTLLHLLAEHPEFDKWPLTFRYFMNIDIEDSKCQTPLHVATIKKNMHAILELTRAGASPLEEDDHNLSPLMLSIQEDFCDGFKLIVRSFEGKKEVYRNAYKLLRTCIDYQADGCFQVIVKALPSSVLVDDDPSKSIFAHCLTLDKPQYLQAILDRGVDPNTNLQDKSFLDVVTNPEIAKLLLSRGAIYKPPQPLPNQPPPPPNFIDKILEEDSNWMTTGHCIIPSELHRAVTNRNEEYIKSYTGNPDILDYDLNTPLMLAIENRDISMIQALIEIGADPSFWSGTTTAYHLAASIGDKSVFEALLTSKKVPDCLQHDSTGKNIIENAMGSGRAALLSLIFTQWQPDISTYVDTLAASLFTVDDQTAGAILTGLLLLNFDCSMSFNEHTLLKEAVDRGMERLSCALIRNNGLHQEEIDDLVLTAVINELSTVVPELLNRGANPSIVYHGKSLLFSTIHHKSDAVRNSLLAASPSLSSSTDALGNNFLHAAMSAGNQNSARYALEILKIDPNSTNSQGDTPLHVLMHYDGKEFADLFKGMIAAGANIKALDQRGRNIVHIVVDSSNQIGLSSLEELLSEEEFIEMIKQEDNNGEIPIVLSAKKGNTKVNEILSKHLQHPIFDNPLTLDILRKALDDGLKPNIATKDGVPILTVAIKTSSDDCVEMAKLLLDAGSDPSQFDEVEHLTPLHHAIRTKNEELVKTLIDAGSSFIVEPVVMSFADQEFPEICDMIKQPERRASAVEEVLNTQRNVIQTLAAMMEYESRFANESMHMACYIRVITKFHRLLTMFVNTLNQIFIRMKPSTEFGAFFLYFAEGFTPFLDIPTMYHSAVGDVKSKPSGVALLNEITKFNNYSLADCLIVPVQQLTRYHELVRAIVKATPPDHPDYSPLVRAHLKYRNIGLSSNEQMLIAESQQKLSTIKFLTGLGTEPFEPNDILLYHGLFERKSFTEPQKGTDIVESELWNVDLTEENDSGKRRVQYFVGGRKLKKFFKRMRIGIYLFRKFVIFGFQKREDHFKVKFACCTHDVIWDFSKDFGADQFAIYTPVGMLLLKVDPGKASTGDFEKMQWKGNIEKLMKVDDEEEKSPNGFEICHVTWVGSQNKCTRNQTFMVECSSKTEAKEKIEKKLAELGIQYESRTNAMGQETLISVAFQTHRQPQGQECDILMDVEI